MKSIGGVLASALVAAYAVTWPVHSESAKQHAESAKSRVAPSSQSAEALAHDAEDSDEDSASTHKPTAVKDFPVTLPEAKAAAEAKTKPPATWPAAEIALAKARCTAILKRIQAVAIPEAPIKQGICGTPAPIQLVSVGRNPEIALSPPVTVTCEMAEALYTWMKTDVQPLAKQKLGAEVIKIETMSSYSCRNAYGRKGGRLSEHGLANAIDIRGFVTSAGRHAYLLDHWGTTQREIRAQIAAAKAKAEAARLAAEKAAAEKAVAVKAPPVIVEPAAKPPVAVAAPSPAAAPATPSGTKVIRPALTEDADAAGDDSGTSLSFGTGSLRKTFSLEPDRLGGPKPDKTNLSEGERRRAFLHEVHASACRTFGTTLGPEANQAHRNHLHIDLAQRNNGLKICE